MAAVELFVPGRLCVMGEHSDWMARHQGVVKGATIVCSTMEGIFATCRRQEPPLSATSPLR